MAILILADHDGQALSGQTAKVLSAAEKIGGPIDILVAGHDVADIARAAANLVGVRQVLLADHQMLEHLLAEPVAALIASLSDDYDCLMAAATTTGKSAMPRVAALLDVMQVSDVIKIISPTVFKRPIFAGNAITTVEAAGAKRVLTIRTSAFPAADPGGEAPVVVVEINMPAPPTQFVENVVIPSERPDLANARVIVAGGRALGSREQFEALILPLADTLSGAVGASRAAVDAGYAPNDWQVGQTGKVVAPELYIAIGISGAIQHVSGIQDAGTIVAINSDPDAPIFQTADLGLVGDLFEIVPALANALKS